MSNNPQPIAAVILAAGIGKRISDMLPDRPKGFIEIAGTAIIERSIRQLKAVGIRDIVIVTGYASVYYERLAVRYPEIRLIKNERYTDTGSMFSLYCARGHVQGPFLLVESDLVYETRALRAILSCSTSNAILMSGFTRSDDEVYISTRGDHVVKLSKNPDILENITGELVGISRISPDMFNAMIRYAAAHFEQTPMLYYEDCINGITDEMPVFHHKVDDLIWAEIDTPAHLQRVERMILPRLLGEWDVAGD